MVYKSREGFGRPPIPKETIAKVVEHAENGDSPAVAVKATGVGKTKVYEIYRTHAETRQSPGQVG